MDIDLLHHLVRGATMLHTVPSHSRVPIRGRIPLVRSPAGTALAVAVLFLTPATALAESPSPDVCRTLYRGEPRGGLRVTSDIPSGAGVDPGTRVLITATWDPAAWDRPDLHKVLDCVTVDGAVDYALSAQEKPAINDGEWSHAFTVPDRPGAVICDRVRLSVRPETGADLVVQKSNVICFQVSPIEPAIPIVPAREEPLVVATPLPEPVPAPPADPGPAPGVEPAVGFVPTPAPLALPELPRTGAGIAKLVGAALGCLGGGRAARLSSR